jgi:NAD+ kinase
MKRFGLVCHPNIAEAQRLSQAATVRLKELGVQAWTGSAWEEDELLKRARGSDLLLSFGGDGTLVRLARLTAGLNIPILGVNLGRVGFLAELQPNDVVESLDALAEGRFWLEERMMLRAELEQDGGTAKPFEAINEVVVSRGRVARIVRIAAHVDGQYLTTYAADGVIVASPTGSTAYALAVGGPILNPQLANLVVVPIAPHLTVDTALVLPATAHVRLVLSTEEEGTLTVDGQVDHPLCDGAVVVVTASSNLCRFVRMGERNYFYKTLMQKIK